MSLVSIIIPTYKRPQQLKNALTSVLNQSHPDLEIIIINDDTEEIEVLKVIEDFGDDRIRYFRNERKKGGNGARNTGVLQSKGKIITFLDDDDLFEPQRLKKSLDFLNQNNFAGLTTGFNFLSNESFRKISYAKHEFTLRNYLLRNIGLGSGSNLVLNKESIKEKDLLWDEDLIRHQDIEYVLRLLANYSFGHLPEFLLIVNGHNGTPNAGKVEQAKEMLFKKVIPYFKGVEKSVKNKFFAFHYLEMAKLYCQEGNYSNVLKFLKKSLQYKVLKPTMYVRIPFLYFQNLSIRTRRGQ